jgi:hypothetical protein
MKNILTEILRHDRIRVEVDLKAMLNALEMKAARASHSLRREEPKYQIVFMKFFLETHAINKHVSHLPLPVEANSSMKRNNLPIGALNVTTNASLNDPMRLYGISNSIDNPCF